MVKYIYYCMVVAVSYEVCLIIKINVLRLIACILCLTTENMFTQPLMITLGRQKMVFKIRVTLGVNQIMSQR